MPEPADSLTAVLGAMADRVERYAAIAQSAARANARGEYSTDDALLDIQEVFKLALSDVTEASAAILASLSAYAQPAEDAPAKKAPAKKKTAKKPSVKKKAPARRPK